MSQALPPSPADAPEPRLRKLWLCADDYGISPAVNRAIRDLIARGRINATSVMVTAPHFSAAEAQALSDLDVAGRTPTGAELSCTEATWTPSPQGGGEAFVATSSLNVAPMGRRPAIGLHFTLTAPFRPVTSSYRPVAEGAFLSLPRTLAAGMLRRLDSDALAAEAADQFMAFRTAFGRPPDFVDGHQHVHLLPQVSDAVLAVMKRMAPGAWIRQCGRTVPLRHRWSDPKGLLLDLLSARLRRRSAACGVRTNPAFAGTYDFKRATGFETLFGAFLQGLPDGGLVMCHPGFVDAELQRLDPLTTMREQEHAFFAGVRFPALLAAHGMELA